MAKKLEIKDNDRSERGAHLGPRVYAADFETTTGEWSTEQTKVWSFCIDEVGHYDPEIYGSIEDFFRFCGDQEKGKNKRIYFHNLKFDGEFILFYALDVLKMRTSRTITGGMGNGRYLQEGEIVYAISDMGQWYFIQFVLNGCHVEIRDSLKLMPFPLKYIGQAFCKRYQKTTMDYDNKTSLDDCTEKDIEYIKNDVLVLSEALAFLTQIDEEAAQESPFDPINSLTIGGACLAQFKATVYGDYKHVSPRLNEQKLPKSSGSANQDEYIRHAYRGGYCYVNPKYAGKLLNEKGYTMDVNSLYPFAMCTSYSGNSFPVGAGNYEKGKPAEKLEGNNFYYYARIKVAFELKSGYVPTIQIKKDPCWPANLYLESSRIYSKRLKQYVGDPEEVELTLSRDDLALLLEHYNVLKIKYLDYIWFYTAPNIFDEYIKKYEKIKTTSKGARRSLAKLLSNNLYGQMSKSTNSSFKIVKGTPYLGGRRTTSGPLEYQAIPEYEKKPVNIAIGAAITARARRYQIETIQANLSHFCYSDTDSLHCIGDPSEFIGRTHDRDYGAYKCEHVWTRARFVRQKTYIEEVENGEWNICAAGMTAQQKLIFRYENKFEDFNVGLTIHGGKLKPVHVNGGVILEEEDFTII